MQLKHKNTHVNSAQIILILSNLHVEYVPDSTVRSYIKIVIHIQQRPYFQSISTAVMRKLLMGKLLMV